MTLTPLTPKAPVLFQFDGTQQSIDDLNNLIQGGMAAAEYVDSGHYKFTNNTDTWPLATLGDIEDSTALLLTAGLNGWSGWPIEDLDQVRAGYDGVPA